MYSEMVYFEGAHFAHIVAYHEDARLREIAARALGQYHRGGVVDFVRHAAFLPSVQHHSPLDQG